MSEQTGVTCDHPMLVGVADVYVCARCHALQDSMGRAIRIVPADAVVVTPEIAATAAEACDSWAISCAVSARQEKSVGHHDVAEAAERRYAACKAAAAALRGEG